MSVTEQSLLRTASGKASVATWFLRRQSQEGRTLGKPPSPKLAEATALSKSQATGTRLDALVPTLTTVLSPVTVYQPGGTVGGQLATPTAGVGYSTDTDPADFYGVWVAPDLLG